MNIVIGYGLVAVFLILVVVVLEKTSKRPASGFSDYATGGRSFGSWFQAMSFMNTWLPGSIFVAFAAGVVAGGAIGFYVLLYSLLAAMIMFFMAGPVHVWGVKFDLRTQADLLGFRYQSRAVRRTAAVIGLACMFPWAILGFQSLSLVFQTLGYGSVSALAAIVISIVVLAFRQIWTVRMGMRGVVVSDMIQGIVAYGLGFVVILGMISWLIPNGYTLDQVPAEAFSLPGPGSELGPLYLMSIVGTGAIGGWCWPDIFVRLFTARSVSAIKKSAALAAPMLMAFCSALLVMALLASTMPGVQEDPISVWFTVTAIGGPVLVGFAGVCVIAATMGNVDALIQASSAQITNDFGRETATADSAGETSLAKWGAVIITALAAVGALLWGDGAGLNTLAIVSYAGIVQLGPTLYFGLFWRRGSSAAALASMISGFAVAALLQVLYPTSIPWLAGMTSGMAGLIVNALVYIGCAYLVPQSKSESERVDTMFDAVTASLGTAKPLSSG